MGKNTHCKLYDVLQWLKVFDDVCIADTSEGHVLRAWYLVHVDGGNESVQIDKLYIMQI